MVGVKILYGAVLCCTLLFTVAVTTRDCSKYHNQNTVDNRGAIVHMFEWRWDDIADECENFLGPMGYGAVQTSPPQSNVIVTASNPPRPWWERYQPTSYVLVTRSGNRSQFIDMVTRCNNAGVRVYVDAVINHASGSGRGAAYDTAGNFFNATAQSFPAVPYDISDFNSPFDCPTGPSQAIRSWDDPVEVRNCRLVGLLDLATGFDRTRRKIAAYLNDMIDIGIAGIRIDAAKHIWPDDIQAILDLTHDLNRRWFPAGSRLLNFQEVIYWGNSPITNAEYTCSGRLSMFIYGHEISQSINGGGGRSLSSFTDPGASWGAPWLDSNNALVFIDNHDTQRHDNLVLNFKNPYAWKLAATFMLAHPYGAALIMSSYDFTNADAGPPTVSATDFNLTHVQYANGQCVHPRVCEHRWPEVANAAKFRWITAGEPIVHWTTGGGGQVAFGRGSKGFFAINKDGGSFERSFQTNMQSGTYCDVINGGLSAGSCTGVSINVNGNGVAHFSVQSVNGKLPVVAFHVQSRVGGYVPPTGNPSMSTAAAASSTSMPTGGPTMSSPAGYQRTVVFLYKQTIVGQDVFLRGGLDGSHAQGCTAQVSTDHCAIPIIHNQQVPEPNTLQAWSQNDNYLDWHGAEPNQGTFGGRTADGTPMAWTTNVQGQSNYSPLNAQLNLGANYWMLDVMMDCSRTTAGWFEFKGYMNGWENNLSEKTCGGSAGGTLPYMDGNHLGRCGFINIFQWGGSSCTINHY